MKTKYFLLGISFIILYSCRKPVDSIEPMNSDLSLTCYENFSDDDFDYIKQHLIGQSIFGPSFEQMDEFTYFEPVFNPTNPNEIVYVRINYNEMPSLENELWKFNLCTGETTLLTDNFYYNIDWSIDGWILYTGTGHKIYKIKDNGDSLTVLSTLNGYNRAGKWNPSGELFWNKRDGEKIIVNDQGIDISSIASNSIFPVDWIDDTILIGLGPGWHFHSFNITDETLTELNNNNVCYSCPKIYDRKNNVFYVVATLGTGQDDYYLRYDLSGTNTVDTLKSLYDSYYYGRGSYAEGKIITTLTRQHWKDSIADIRYVRRDLLLMNADGTDEKMIVVP